MKTYRIWRRTEVVYDIEANSPQEAIAISRKKKVEDASWINIDDGVIMEDDEK